MLASALVNAKSKDGMRKEKCKGKLKRVKDNIDSGVEHAEVAARYHRT
ncbi:hypothetical protein M2R47_04140 [Moraxella sp. Tifton1]|nr:hypothetical protein [Moraxella sp. Tifton1]MCL1623440.1 hypothetical protein [Moraxella sp. Tifton1]